MIIMLKFLDMLRQPQQQQQQETSNFDRFVQALGASQMGKGSQKTGMSYAQTGGEGANAAQNAQALMASLQGGQKQRQDLPTFNPLLQMLMGGGQQ